MRTFIAGRGEVGGALERVLRIAHDVTTYDVQDGQIPIDSLKRAAVLNICFPYNQHFLEQVDGYAQHLSPDAIIIVHSTVPVGTTRKINHPRRCHSPVHGIHPNIDVGLQTFTKYVGAVDVATAGVATAFLKAAKIPATMISSPEASELSKLCCTLQYGLLIMACKGIAELCEQYGVPFDEVYGWNSHYNSGYARLARNDVRRALLKPVPGPIGGHCVVPNARLLPGWLSQMLLDANARFEE